MDAETVYSDKFQDPLVNLTIERSESICDLAFQDKGRNES